MFSEARNWTGSGLDCSRWKWWSVAHVRQRSRAACVLLFTNPASLDRLERLWGDPAFDRQSHLATQYISLSVCSLPTPNSIKQYQTLANERTNKKSEII